VVCLQRTADTGVASPFFRHLSPHVKLINHFGSCDCGHVRFTVRAPAVMDVVECFIRTRKARLQHVVCLAEVAGPIVFRVAHTACTRVVHRSFHQLSSSFKRPRKCSNWLCPPMGMLGSCSALIAVRCVVVVVRVHHRVPLTVLP